jgi:hypothetical protein
MTRSPIDRAMSSTRRHSTAPWCTARPPGLYRALEERYGVDETTDALAAVVADHAFDQVAPDDLRAALGEALGDPAGVDSLWNRWLEERHGDEDLSD